MHVNMYDIEAFKKNKIYMNCQRLFHTYCVLKLEYSRFPTDIDLPF
jgi:hypothetical protein